MCVHTAVEACDAGWTCCVQVDISGVGADEPSGAGQ